MSFAQMAKFSKKFCQPGRNSYQLRKIKILIFFYLKIGIFCKNIIIINPYIYIYIQFVLKMKDLRNI